MLSARRVLVRLPMTDYLKLAREAREIADEPPPKTERSHANHCAQLQLKLRALCDAIEAQAAKISRLEMANSNLAANCETYRRETEENSGWLDKAADFQRQCEAQAAEIERLKAALSEALLNLAEA